MYQLKISMTSGEHFPSRGEGHTVEAIKEGRTRKFILSLIQEMLYGRIMVRQVRFPGGYQFRGEGQPPPDHLDPLN